MRGVPDQQTWTARRRLGGSQWVPSGDLSQFQAPDGQVEVSPRWAQGSVPSRSRRKKKRRRSWARRHPFLLIVVIGFLMIGVAAAYVASQVASTSSTILQQSTPPPVVKLRLGEDVEGVLPSDQAPTNDEASDGEPLAIDTAPARAAVADAGLTYKGGPGVISGMTEVIEGGAAASGLIEGDTEPINVLLMGVDARSGESIDVGVRPDSLAVLRLNPKTGGCAMIRIPRDTRVELPGYGMSKINHALAVGGIPYQELVVEGYLGIQIDRYALIDFSGVESLVDAVGGVTITITDSFTFGQYTFAPGERRIDGAEALAFSRYRGGADGDFGRIRRQQQIVRGLIASARDMEPRTMLDLLPLLEEHVRMDLAAPDLVVLAEHFKGKCTEETLVIHSLEGSVATLDDAVFGMPLSFVVVEDAEMRRKVEELLTV